MLDNPRSDAVRSLARLRERSHRQALGLFLAEGPPSVSEALARAVAVVEGGGRTDVREVVITPAAAQRHADLVGASHAAGARVRLATEQVVAALCDTTTPQGVVAVCATREVDLDVALRRPADGGPALVAVLVGSSDPGNAGTVIRSADAAGAGAVVLTTGSVDAHGPRCVRAAAGSTFHLDVVQGPSLDAVVARARACGLTVLAADGGAGVDALDLDDLLDAAEAPATPADPALPPADPALPPADPSPAPPGPTPLPGGPTALPGGPTALLPAPAALLSRPVVWLFGHEARGLTGAQRDLADAVVRVPLHGRAESLNLAAAATVCLYASARAQRRAACPSRPRPADPSA